MAVFSSQSLVLSRGRGERSAGMLIWSKGKLWSARPHTPILTVVAASWSGELEGCCPMLLSSATGKCGQGPAASHLVICSIVKKRSLFREEQSILP